MRRARRWFAWVAAVGFTLVALCGGGQSYAEQGAGGSIGSELEALRKEVEELRRRDEENRRREEENRRRIEALTQALEQLAEKSEVVAREPVVPEPVPADPEAALEAALADLETEPSSQPSDSAVTRDVWTRQVGGAQVRLIDISADILFAGGWSTVDNEEIEGLQGHFHDPRKNGFTLQGIELSVAGAVDPYFRGEAHIVAFADGLELEEAFIQTLALPGGLQVEAGHFFTEFGLINPRHPHQWDWIDSPIVNTRMFGGDSLRSQGLRLAWLTPLPWSSELHVGVQNPDFDSFTKSFIGGSPIGGRPEVGHDVDGPDDMLWLARWVNAFDFTPELTGVLGVSGLSGPNDTGADGQTWIYGLDYRMKWVPRSNFRGYPYVVWQTEAIKRDYTADWFLAGTEMTGGGGGGGGGVCHGGHCHGGGEESGGDEESEFTEDLPSAILRDWGVYTQLIWGFRPNWSVGLRLDYVDGTGGSIDEGMIASRQIDFDRDTRWRVSPLLTWWPSHFSRLRLQYNYDHARHLDGNDAHSVWMGAEVLFGEHPPHEY